MPKLKHTLFKFRRFLQKAKQILGLVLLVLEILRRLQEILG